MSDTRERFIIKTSSANDETLYSIIAAGKKSDADFAVVDQASQMALVESTAAVRLQLENDFFGTAQFFDEKKYDVPTTRPSIKKRGGNRPGMK